MQEMIVASRLTDGLVVFLDEAGGWTEDFHRGAILADASARQAALEKAERAAADNLVVEPYAIQLEMSAGHLVPKALRERIRCFGPTVRPDLGKQAQGFAPAIAQRG